jgi:transposase
MWPCSGLTAESGARLSPNADAGFADFQAWLAVDVPVCMEATGAYWEVVPEALTDAGFTVSVANLARIKADAVDARLIADFCARPPALRERCTLVACREARVVMRTQEQNRLPSGPGPRTPTSKPSSCAPLECVIAEVRAAIWQRIDHASNLQAQGDLLDSLPGLGQKTIPVFWSFYGGPVRFDRARQAAAFAGLDPRPSGSKNPRH